MTLLGKLGKLPALVSVPLPAPILDHDQEPLRGGEEERSTEAPDRHAAHKSSSYPHYCTPPDLLDSVREIGPITLDPFANEWSGPTVRAAAEFHLTRGEDAWVLPWPVGVGVAFCNPKYGRTMPRSIMAMNRCAADGGTVVALVAARPDTLWFQAADAQLACFLRGRIHFLDPRTGMAPTEAGALFPSALLIWSAVAQRLDAFVRAFEDKGRVVDWQQYRR